MQDNMFHDRLAGILLGTAVWAIPWDCPPRALPVQNGFRTFVARVAPKSSLFALTHKPDFDVNAFQAGTSKKAKRSDRTPEGT
jgi:hypothetical protein